MIVDAFPLTKNGKLDRALLPIPERQTRQTITEPLTTLQQAVATIWTEVLELEQIDLHDNFFDLGGHSLLGAQVISRVGEAFNLDIYLRTLFEQPTLAGFSAVVEEQLIAELLAQPEEVSDRMTAL
jgi:phosphopantetheine binding protein